MKDWFIKNFSRKLIDRKKLHSRVNQAIESFDGGKNCQGRIFISGLRALVRLPLMIRQRDEEDGLKTGGLISGYRGSPLGSYDQHLWAASKFLQQSNIVFVPGLNEEIAATAIWGSQQVSLDTHKQVDGVFGIWYAKGPGVDRSGDPIKHANNAGTSRFGGVLCLAGDDHAAKSSTCPHQSDLNLRDMNVPVLAPSDLRELLEFGLFGISLSRYSGCWIGMKVTAELADRSVSLDPRCIRRRFREPDLPLPLGGLHIRLHDDWNSQETRLYRHRLPAVLAFSRANSIDRVCLGSLPVAGTTDGKQTEQRVRTRLGVVCAGKSYLDVMEILRSMGIRDVQAREMGLAVYKVGMVWPLEPEGLQEFAEGLEEVLVVEEKRSLLEAQVKDILYDTIISRPKAYGLGSWQLPPRVFGKCGPDGMLLLREDGELTPVEISAALLASFRRVFGPAVSEVAAATQAAGIGHSVTSSAAVSAAARLGLKRGAYFCAGCPHNTSTRPPLASKDESLAPLLASSDPRDPVAAVMATAAAEGMDSSARVLGGIGCHTLSMFMAGRGGKLFSQMGGEGAGWIGMAPFVTAADFPRGTAANTVPVRRPHSFANVGDGTYFHSASLAVRACAAAGVNLTYRILFNGAVAMTGGQPHDASGGGALGPSGGAGVSGPGSVTGVCKQLLAEGVREVVVVADDPSRYGPGKLALPEGVGLEPRQRMAAVQRRLQSVEGVTAIIYDQMCATEKRRAQKRGKLNSRSSGSAKAGSSLSQLFSWWALRPTINQADSRMFINERVCEGCGDCGKQSNCVAIVPKETTLGRKRAIDQAICNTDHSCNLGFCPSFVSVVGAQPRGTSFALEKTTMNLEAPWFDVPEPCNFHHLGVSEYSQTAFEEFSVLICGVGGAGVVTAAAILGRAAHIEGLEVSVLDQIGLSQKNGAVVSHIRMGRKVVSDDSESILHQKQQSSSEVNLAPRIGSGGATLVLAMDLLTACLPANLSTISPTRTAIVANLHGVMPGQFSSDPDLLFPSSELLDILAVALSSSLEPLPDKKNCRQDMGGYLHIRPQDKSNPSCSVWQWTPTTRPKMPSLFACDFRSLAVATVDDPQLANAAALGYAFQLGMLPLLTRKSLVAALDAVAPGITASAANRLAFEAGRRAAYDPVALAAAVKSSDCENKVDSEKISVPWHLPSNTAFQVEKETWEDCMKATASKGRDIDDMIRTRFEFLTEYQNREYADKFQSKVTELRSAEEAIYTTWASAMSKTDASAWSLGDKMLCMGDLRLTRAAADGLFRLMAHKDEYEVARLYTDGDFESALRSAFVWNPDDSEAMPSILLHLSPPGASSFLRDADTGFPRKIAVPYPVIRPLLRLLAKARILRGTMWDPLRWSSDRCKARQLLAQFEDDMRLVCSLLRSATAAGVVKRATDQSSRSLSNLDWYPTAIELLEAVGKVRGYGHVRDQANAVYTAKRESLLQGLLSWQTANNVL